MAFSIAATSAFSPGSIAVFAAVALGQYMLARAVLGWIHSHAVHDHVWPLIVAAGCAAAIAGLLLMLSKIGMHGPRLLRGGEWTGVSWAWMVYIIGSIAALIAGMVANVRMARRREPAVQVSIAMQHENFAQILGHVPSGGGLSGFIARIPGNELFLVDIIERHLRLSSLPPAWSGMSIVHLSDLHFCGTPDRTFFERTAEKVNELSPDIIVLTGDVIDTQKVSDWLGTTLGRMRAPLGRFFVLGNHDEHAEPAAIRAELARHGWIDVAGKCVSVEHRGGALVIGGTELPWMGTAPEFPVKHSSAPPSFRMLLSHAPGQLSWAAQAGVDLMFAGHLHGGQICLPVLGPVKSGPMLAGIFQQGPTVMHLSRGLGEMTPLRWRCRPEITKLVLE